jgi:hypothetical protein
MTAESRYTEAEFHRKMAVRYFNETWDFLEKPNRTDEEDERMIHSAHASRLHWGAVGTPTNFIIGEWQVSRVYAVLQQPESSLYHARRGLAWCEREKIGGFHLAYCYEAIARALSLVEGADALLYLHLAEEIADTIEVESERNRLLDDLKTIPIAGTAETNAAR